MDLDYYAIGNRIKSVRESAGYTQEKLAEMADISKTHISHIENGKTKFSLKTLVSIANALDTTADILLFDNMKKISQPIVWEVFQFFSECSAQDQRLYLEYAEHVRKIHRKNY